MTKPNTFQQGLLHSVMLEVFSHLPTAFFMWLLSGNLAPQTMCSILMYSQNHIVTQKERFRESTLKLNSQNSVKTLFNMGDYKHFFTFKQGLEINSTVQF